MSTQHSPLSKDTRSQRHQAVLTPKERAPHYCTPSVHQVSANLDRGPPMKGEEPSRRVDLKSLSCWVAIQAFMKGLTEDEEGEESMGEEESGETEVSAALAGAPEACKALNIVPSNQPLFSKD
ncbi:hypothetical protein O181_031534 [Austropuccinia psidii MF-1]|uniref:Uncharacterized protein n=1 Tax=Austropuccinia psidii MF-1 TaxID=1389203 RepID=A0A9Q3CV27_9BASI|nr:hypothetical protein [Austropuccinia psidii MF-1]